MIASLNANSFDYKSNGFELGHGKRKVQNVGNFGGDLKSDETKYENS